MASQQAELQARLNRRFAWALELYGRTMQMQGKEWKGIRRTSTPEQLSAFVVEFKTNAFRTFVRQATGASNVRVEYYDLDCNACSPAELETTFAASTLAYDDGTDEHVIRLPRAWLTEDYARVFRSLNPQLERALVTIWQREGCPDAPEAPPV